MNAQGLRHRITIQSKGDVIDPATGYTTPGWFDRLVNEPAQFMAGPGREYLASEATRAEVSGRFVIRWSQDAMAVTAGDRVLWDGRVMALKAPPLPDETARRSLTLMVGEESGADGS